MKSKHGYGNIIIECTSLGNEVNTIILGDGSTRVCTTFIDEENVAGISFAKSPSIQGVGYEFVTDGIATDPKEEPLWQQKNAYFQILSDNPASIDVLITRLQEAKEHLIKIRSNSNGGDV